MQMFDCIPHYWTFGSPVYNGPILETNLEDYDMAKKSEAEKVREEQKEQPTNVTAEERNLADANTEGGRVWNHWDDAEAAKAEEAAKKIGHETTPDPAGNTPDVEEPVRPHSR